MGNTLHSGGAVLLLGRLFRERRSGVLTLGRGDEALVVVVRQGLVSRVRLPRPQRPRSAPGPDDSAQLKLDRVLAEVGIRPGRARAPRGAEAAAPGLQERLVRALVESRAFAFVDGAEPPEGSTEVAGATEPLLLEALGRLQGDLGVRDAIGDLDQRLVAAGSRADERTLTLTEGRILSRVDGSATAREVLDLVPSDGGETERTLLGLLVTGRLEARPPLPRLVQRAQRTEKPAALADATEVSLPATGAVPAGEAGEGTPAGEPADEPPVDERAPEAGMPVAEPEPVAAPSEEDAAAGEAASEPSAETPTAPMPPLDPALIAKKREILELFEALPLRNHFEVLGVEMGCQTADVKRAYIALAKRFHPDVYHDPALAELHDKLEAIFIRIGQAWEELGDTARRNAYKARLAGPVAPAARGPIQEWVPPEETLASAQLLITQARYWDAIQLLESAIPRMEPTRLQSRGRILLARAYAKNPNWLRRAEEMLHAVVRDDPTNADAHYELGLLYKAGGLAARAQGMFRRAVELRPEHREAAAELGEEPPAPSGLLKRLFGRGKAS